jgi:archaellin
MLWVVGTFVVLVVVAVVVVAAVALPHLRTGSPVLTPKGEQVVREARARLTNSQTSQ